MIVQQAFADGPAAPGGFDFAGLIPFLLIIVIMYFFLIRPQQKKAKEHQALLAALKKGDKVVTSGGFLGKIDKLVDNNEVVLELADGVKVPVLRSAISQLRADSSKEAAKTTEKAQSNSAAMKKASKLKNA